MQIPCWNRASISCRFLVFAYKRRPTYIAKGCSATTSFHGTGISVFQHPVSPTFSVSRTFEFKGQKPKSKAISCLPETYTNVKPAFLKSKPFPTLGHMRCKCHAETGRLSVAAFLSLHTREDLHK
jgi:hypothetical protein